MELHVSLVGRKNLRAEIYRQLRRAIIDGVLRSGDCLPPTRELAARLGVSRTTVTVAYDSLAAEGYVTGRVGSGTFVSFHPRAVETKTPDAGKPGVLRPQPVWDSVQLPVFSPAQQFNFRSGGPDGSLFPRESWRRLVARELRTISRTSSSGYDDAAGRTDLREAIARHIAVSRGIEASAADMTITNGTQQALDIIARVMLAPGDRVAVENPGYLPAVQLLRSLGARVIRVPVDDEGLVVDALPNRVRLLYVTPAHQFPLGMTMSMPRREALLAWAERTGSAIVEDDYDSEFRFGGRPLEPLHTLDTTGRVIYIGSFSKTMLPSLRLGFVLSPSSLRRAVQKAKHVSDWHTNALIQAVFARFIDDGEFARHVRKVGNVYRARHEKILRILGKDFGDVLLPLPSEAGIHIAARARSASFDEIDSVVHRAREQEVFVHSLSEYPVDKGEAAGLVLGYGGIATEDIDDGLRRLRTCFADD